MFKNLDLYLKATQDPLDSFKVELNFNLVD